MSEEARRLARAARFGIVPVAAPATAPAVKVATTPTSASPSVPQAPKATPPTVMSMNIDPELLKRRQDRFGIVNPAVPKIIAASEEAGKKQKRSERFSSADGGASEATEGDVPPPSSPKKVKV